MTHRFLATLPTWLLAVLLLTGCLRPASTGAAGLPSLQASQTFPPEATWIVPSKSSAGPTLSPTLALMPEVSPPSPPTLPARPARLVFRLPRQAFPPGLNLNGNYQVFLGDIDGSNLVPLTPRLGGDLVPLDISSGGEVLVSSGTRLYAAPLIPGEPRLLAENYTGPAAQRTNAGTSGANSGMDSGAYWLAGGGVAYIGLESGERAIFRVNPDGSGQQRLTLQGDQPMALLPSMDLARVAWRSCPLQNAEPVFGATVIPDNNTTITPGDPGCYHWTALDAAQTHPLLPGAQVAALAPQRGAIAYHAANGGGWQAVPVYAIDGEGRLAGETEPLNVCSLAWSLDGSKLLIGQLFGENFCGWYLLWQPGGSELEELPEDLPASYAQRWSPDGGSILLEDWSGAWIYELASGTLIPALSPAGETRASHILWVP